MGKEQEYRAAIVIGRFQPFHNAHLDLVKKALELGKEVIVVIGSHRAAPNIKNPFSFEQRQEMIKQCFAFEDIMRLKFVPVRDYYYNDDVWVAELLNKVHQLVERNSSIALVGNTKDSSSYYLNLFPDWDYVPARFDKNHNIDATTVRNLMFTEHKNEKQGWTDYPFDPQPWKKLVPTNVGDWLNNHFMGSDEFTRLKQEFDAVNAYKASWATAPFPPVFVTSDAVILHHDHILLVKRNGHPGKGMWALPGGFVRQSEDVFSAAVRELREETGLVLKKTYEKYTNDQRVFDHPDRSLRGRTITHAFFWHIKDIGPLAQVQAADDAADCVWMPLAEIAERENEFFEDHLHIINYFIKRAGARHV